ncbi:MAG: hypothetical protein ACOXZI_05890 [Candidatus Cryptobacteroides sp.]|jgi:hypothetical protein|nr:hypothetical protein [Rikenellaceae bacterium]
MNILVCTADSLVYARPDSSWNRKSEDFYAPDFIDYLSFTPVLYAHISHAGKCIGESFAPRYYDAVGYGMLLYAQPFKGLASFAASACLDGTSFLPELSLESSIHQGFLSIKRYMADKAEAETLFRFPEREPDAIHKAIAAATRSCLVRRGDLICLELTPLLPLCSRKDEPCRIELSSESKIIQSFKIIFA